MYPSCVQAIALLLIVSAAPSTVCGQSLFERFVPVDQVEARDDGDYTLVQEHGPWLITAATFNGDGAEQQARELVLELRQRFNLPAYVHNMAFDFSKDMPGRGLDNYGAPVRRRYQRGDKIEEWVVLVGDFPAVDDPRAQQQLKRLKTLQPASLNVGSDGQSAQSLSEVRQFHNRLLAKMGHHAGRGPMAKAFLVPNPLLPREYFVAKGVDDFVAEMNKGVKYSLLDCAGKYTVQVATFRGSSVLQTSGGGAGGGLLSKRKREPTNSLVAAAENAHLLVAELRKHDFDAYVFHDREQSIVTVGSFERAARKLPNGRIVATPAAQRVIETFGAAYNTPADPLLAVGEDPANRARRNQAIQQVSASLANQAGQIATGLNPKHVKILKRKKLVRTIPMDIHPHLIEVPRRSISSSYMRR